MAYWNFQSFRSMSEHSRLCWSLCVTVNAGCLMLICAQGPCLMGCLEHLVSARYSDFFLIIWCWTGILLSNFLFSTPTPLCWNYVGECSPCDWISFWYESHSSLWSWQRETTPATSPMARCTLCELKHTLTWMRRHISTLQHIKSNLQLCKRTQCCISFSVLCSHATPPLCPIRLTGHFCSGGVFVLIDTDTIWFLPCWIRGYVQSNMLVQCGEARVLV